MKQFLLFSAFIVIFSCEKKEQVFEKPVNQEEEKVSDLNIQTINSFEIDSTGILAFPLSIGETIESSRIESSFKSDKGSSYWNIIFYNSNTGEKYLLSKQKMLISNYETGYSNYDSSNEKFTQIDTSSKKYIFYNIITDDYDGNKKLNYEDPTYLFFTDKEGKNLKQISPKNLNVVNWKIVPKTRKILINVQKDSNGNKRFDEKDDIISMDYSLDTQKAPVVIFDENYKNFLLENFKKNWNSK